MINELPKDFSSIATTFFEDYDNASRFAKDMEQNMKMLSGIDPLTTNQEVADYINDNNDQELLNGTEDAILQLSDRNAIELATQNMEALGVKKRVNPEISVYDYYTQNEIANKFTDDTYRVNFTNSKEDPSVYSTKYMIGSGKVYDALNSLKPNVTRLAMRYIGQPITSMALSSVGGWIGAGASDAVMAGWDASILGGTIYNTQKKYIDRYHQLLSNSSLSLEQFTGELDNLLTEIQTDVAPEYQYEIFDGIIEGPNRFSDAGLGFTTLGIQIYAKPFTFLAKTAKRMLPSASAGNSIKRMEMNEKLVEQIQKSMSNKVDEAAVDEAISAKVETVKPKDASEADVEMVKGINKNKAVDRDLLQNSNNDSTMMDVKSRRNKMTRAEQKGEIRLEKPVQNYYIDHGKGVDNSPMTLEEAERELKRLQGRKSQVLYRERYIYDENLDEAPEYVAVTTASKAPWESLHVEYRPRTGEGSEAYGGGMYATFADSDWEASRQTYFKNALEKSDKAVLNTHYIPNPEKHPEMYLYYDAEDPGLKPFAINILNLKSDKYFKIAQKQQEVIRSAVKDIESGLQKRIQDAIKEGNTDLVNRLQFDHSFLLDHYDGDMTIQSWADYLRENVYGLDKPSDGFRRWEKEYWKNKGIKGLIHEGEGSTSTNIVIFDEDITSPVTKVETTNTQTGYNNAHTIVSAGDGVGYFVRELHGTDGSKPMIIRNHKVVDKGDWE